MRNRYAGSCYECGKRVEPGQGFAERHEGAWRVAHDGCAPAPAAEPKPGARHGRDPGKRRGRHGYWFRLPGGGSLHVDVSGELSAEGRRAIKEELDRSWSGPKPRDPITDGVG